MPSQHLRPDGAPYLCYLVVGTDPGLVSQELSSLLDVLGNLDQLGPTPIEEYGGPGEDNFVVGPVLDACRTPPFLGTRRIIVVREASVMLAAQTAEVVAYLNDPLDTSVLVLAHSTKAAPAALLKAVKAAGTVINATPASTARARNEWFAEHLHEAPVHLNQQAATLLKDHLGEDLARLEGTMATLEATFGKGATIHVDELEPFLGTAGAVAPWDLTDALDSGDSAAAMVALDRLMTGGERHPLQILTTLHRHYGAMLRLDGSEVTDEQGAAAATGMSPFPAKKALNQARRLGHEHIARAIELLATADLDVRGRIGWPPDVVLEVLIARLAQLVRIAKGGSAGQRRTRSRA